MTNHSFKLLTQALLGSFLGLLTIGVHAAEPVRFLISNSWAMPFIERDGDKVTGGIIDDIAKALSTNLKQPVVYVSLPRNRTDDAAAKGEIDVRCYTTTKWVKTPDAYFWTGPLFDISEVLIRSKEAPEIGSINDIKQGTPIGTVLGFYYPALDPFFSSGQIVRDDAADQLSAIEKSARNRNSYTLVNRQVIDWNRRNPLYANIPSWKLLVEQIDFRCAVPKNTSHDINNILRNIEKLKSSGQLNTILQRYN